MNFEFQPDWMRFLHRFGYEIQQMSTGREGRLSAFLSVPFIDYAGVLTATGILTAKYRSTAVPSPDPHDWLVHRGKPVSFPFELNDGGTELKRKAGTIEGVEDGPRGPCLSVLYLEDVDAKSKGRKFTRFVKPRWLPAVRMLEATPNLRTWQHGSRLASNIKALDAVLGESGAAAVVGKSSKDCLLVDVKSRVTEELKDCVELNRIGVEGVGGSLMLADLIRPDGWGPDAMRDTFSSRVAPELEPGWEYAVICGSLNFLRCWDECDSPVRIAVLCPSENSYAEAVDFANEIYYQRDDEVSITEQLLSIKPSAIDFQLANCKQ
jgi:hypothetical protein